MVCLCSWKTYKTCHLQQVIFSFCKFLTTPIVVKYTYTVLNKLSWIGKSHESDLCCYIKVFHVLHGSTKGTTRIVLSVTDHQEKKKFIKWFRYHFYILFGVICFCFCFWIFNLLNLLIHCNRYSRFLAIKYYSYQIRNQ